MKKLGDWPVNTVYIVLYDILDHKQRTQSAERNPHQHLFQKPPTQIIMNVKSNSFSFEKKYNTLPVCLINYQMNIPNKYYKSKHSNHTNQ